MPRHSNSILPDNDELSHILAREVPREVPTANQAIHFPDLSHFRQLLVHFNLPTDIVDDDHLTIHQVVSTGSTLLNSLVPLILSSREAYVKQLSDALYDYLSEQDTPKKSDLLFVFGAPTRLRADKAVEIYDRHLADKILVSGGNAIYHFDKTETEASQYRKILLEAGVPEEVIMTEDKSITIPDNVRRSLTMLEETSDLPHSMIVINSPYAQRRGWAILKKHLSEDTVLYRVNSECSTEYKKEHWYKQDRTLRVVLNEFIKMRASIVYNTA